MKYKIYLAGPFFNKESRALIQKLLDNLEINGHEIFSPMRDGIMCPKDASLEKRKEVFKLDCLKIDWADCVVAILDYPLPIQQDLIMKERTPEGISKEISIILPDSGTIFEIGYAFGLNQHQIIQKPIIGYTEKKSGYNLMISEALDFLAYDLLTLETIICMFQNGKKDQISELKKQFQRDLLEY